jgi:integrase
MAKRRSIRGQGSVYARGAWWHVCYSLNGRKHRESAHTQIREEALAFLQRKLGKAASGEALSPDRVKISDLLTLVQNDYDLKERASCYIAALKIRKYLLPTFGATRAARFKTADLETYIKRRQRDGARAATINRELALLHRGYQLGYQADPPMVARVPHFPKLTEDNARTGFLKRPEYEKLLKVLPLELRLLFVFGYHLGMRKSALLRLKWSQVDVTAGLIFLERKKSAKHVPQALPIYGDMRAFLEMQPRTSEFLFARGSAPIKSFRSAWKTACKAAGMPDLLFHDLRRTAARNLRRAGVPESVAMKITGHKTRSMFERYNIVDEEDIRDVGRRVEFYQQNEESAQISTQNRNERKERFS